MSPADRDDADDLVVRAALGEPLTDQEQARIDADPDLQAEVASFAEVVQLATEAPEEVAPTQTLDHLWEGIAAEAFGAPAAAGNGGSAAPIERAPSARLRPSRRALGIGAVAAAAAAVVALVTVGPLADRDPAPVAVARLAPVDDADVGAVRGDVIVDDGATQLRLDLTSLPEQPEAFYEVWLLDLDAGRMVSLGPARPDGTYALPDGVAVGDYPQVDVSVEPRDGDPAHSGASVLRGPFET